MYTTNQATLDQLFAQGKIHLQRAPLFDTFPPPLPPKVDFDRVEGMLLGLAIGDALGRHTEGQSPELRHSTGLEVRDYPKDGGLPTDDTQLAFALLEHLLMSDGLEPDLLAQRFCRDHISGIGTSMRTFIRHYKDEHRPWDEAGAERPSNGALMRIAPILVPHVSNPTPALWADTALAAMLTHNDPASTAACIALVHLLWEALRMTATPTPQWWIDTFCSAMAPLEGPTQYEPRRPHPPSDKGPVSSYVQRHVQEALAANLPVVKACQHWDYHTGTLLMETIPSVIYILCRHAGNPEEAIVRAVNDTRDNDTVAAIVGTVVGALHGKAGLPQRWRDGLKGRQRTIGPDGEIFGLIAQARKRVHQTLKILGRTHGQVGPSCCRSITSGRAPHSRIRRSRSSPSTGAKRLPNWTIERCKRRSNAATWRFEKQS